VLVAVWDRPSGSQRNTRAGARSGTGALRTVGTLAWHEDAHGKRLLAGRYALQLIATDDRGRSTSRVLPIWIRKGPQNR
jgi:hypothetical protein